MPSEQTPRSTDVPQKRKAAQFYLDKIHIDDEALDVREPDAEAFRRQAQKKRRAALSGSWVLILGFAIIILIGALLLKLPWASATGQSITWDEAFFTATSATTVTGLVVLNTAQDFSFFGQIIILILLQVGGVGFISFSVLLFRLIGRRVTLQTRFIVQQSVGAGQLSGALNLALYVLGITLSLEAAGALLLWMRWQHAMPDGQALWYAVFHAVSSYCNAGFDLFSGTELGVLFGYGTDWYTLAVMGTLILLGGFGVTIMYDLWSYWRDRSLSLHTRMTLTLTAALTVLGFAFLMFDPFFRHGMPGVPWHERAAAGLFSVVSARTAGLTILPIEKLTEASQLVLMLWMFIGGSPASMAGGVSSSTVGVLTLAVLATARGHAAAVAFGRTLPDETIAKAVAIMTVSTLLVVAVTLALSLRGHGPIFAAAFEAVSAFANAGYSIGATADLDASARYLVMFTMFWGRLGPLTIVVALAQRLQPTLVRFPEEPVILG